MIDYSDRFEGIREAVYLLTLNEGVGAISLDAVAPHLLLAGRTLQRLVTSAAALPYLGFQWAEASSDADCYVGPPAATTERHDNAPWTR